MSQSQFSIAGGDSVDSSAPRVLIICPHMPPRACGIADYLAATLDHATREGIEVWVAHDEAAPIPIPRVHLRRLPATVGRAFVNGVLDLVREISPQVIHIQYQPTMYGKAPTVCLLPGYLRRAGVKVPIITTFHDFTVPYLFPKAKPFRPWFVRQLVKNSDWYVITNPLDRITGATRFGALPERMISIPIGSNITPPSVLPPHHVGFTAGYFGLVMMEKGLEVSLEAIALASRDVPDLTFRIIGARRDDGYVSGLRNLAARLGIAHRVQFTGQVSGEEAATQLSALDACLLLYDEGVSTRRTSFPSAMACGAPTITTVADPLPDNLEDGRNCIVVTRPVRAADVAQAIVRLAANPSLRDSIGAAAREWAGPLAYAHIGARHAEMYRMLCSEGLNMGLTAAGG